MALFDSLRRKKKKETYEQRLSTIANKIARCQQQQVNQSIRQRRVTSIFTLYSLLVYIGYAVLLFAFQRPKPEHYAILGVVPAVIFVVRRLIRKWFSYVQGGNEEKLEALKTEQESILEELKETTNFYNTQALLDRFDTAKMKQAPEELKAALRNQRQQPQEGLGQPPQAGGPPSQGTDKGEPVAKNTGKNVPSAAANPSVLPPEKSQIPPTKYEPTWQDRLLDLLMGENENSPNSRMALICAQCRNHNGLASYGEIASEVVYICPHCGFLNGSKSAVTEFTAKLKAKSGSVSPPSSESLISSPAQGSSEQLDPPSAAPIAEKETRAASAFESTAKEDAPQARKRLGTKQPQSGEEL